MVEKWQAKLKKVKKMDPVTLLGILAGVITTIGLLPQVLVSFRTRKTKDLSMGMLVMMNSGLLLWIIYGFMIQNAPLLMADSVSFLINSGLMVLKVKHG